MHRAKTLRSAAILLICLATVALLAIGIDWWYSPVAFGETATYVGRQSCAECHAKETEAWIGSDHDLAMDLATPETVLGDFGDCEFTYQGVTSRMFTKDGRYTIHTEGADGRMQDFLIKYTFGVRPLQQYMVEFPDGRVQVLRISWDTEKKRWFYVPPPDVLDERIEPDDPLHWTGAAQNWNHTCAECHSTDFHKNYDLESNSFASSYSEIDVSCEACHGPGSIHVQLAESRSLFWDRRLGYGLAGVNVPPITTPFDARPLAESKTQLDTCARCHSRRNVLHGDFHAGSEFCDHYETAVIEQGLYHADGQILDEVYVYGSFLQSKMYRKGVACTDCHDPHTARLKLDGNALCTQCHQEGKYDSPTHHHHKPSTEGAFCVDCHMPETTYMVVDPRRDHSLRNPRPDLTVLLGTPNVCNGCHTKEEETPEWAAEQVVQWYGPKRPDDPHYAPALAAARAGQPEGEKLLLKVLRHPETPAIVRATAMELLAQYSSKKSTNARLQGLVDESPLVRASAVRSAEAQPPGKTLGRIGPLLSDPVRAVRIAAARRLVGIPPRLLSDEQRKAFDEGLADYREAQLASADRAGAHLNLGFLHQELGQQQQAITSYETAIRLEPYLAGPRSNLATLLEQSGGDPAKVRQLREEEVERLARDARLLPDNPLTQYRYGLTLYLIGRLDEAAVALEEACRLAPGSYDYRLMLTLFYQKRRQWDAAFESAKMLLMLRPNDPTARQLLGQIYSSAQAAGRARRPPAAGEQKKRRDPKK